MSTSCVLRRWPGGFTGALPTAKHGSALRQHLHTAAVAPRTGARTSAPRRVLALRAKKDADTQLGQAVKTGLVNPAFAAVLSEALSRGVDEDLGGAESSMEAERAAPIAAVEGVLEAAVLTSRQKMQRLMQQQSQIEAEIGTEAKQLERLQYLLGKVRNDYAYFHTLEKMNDRQSAANQRR